MEIAVAAPDPMTWVATDYVCGEVTLVWRTGPVDRQLIFAVVELLPPSAEADPGDRLCPAPSTRLPRSSDELHCGRAHLDPVAATQWYRSCLTGRVDLPVPLQTPSSVLSLATGTLADEPAWPVLPLERKAFWEHSALWGDRPGEVRRHQLVQLAPEQVIDGWAPEDIEAARAWLSKWMPIDVLSEPVLHGSAHLILPNPIFTGVFERLGKEADEQIFFEVVPHAGRSVVGLEVCVKESRLSGPALLTHFTLQEERVRLTLPHRPHEIAFTISCPERGLLYESPTAGFMAQIFVSGFLAGRERKITVPGKRTRAEETFRVPVHEHEIPIRVGDPLDAAVAKVSIHYAENDARREARRFEQHWFDGDREKATELIRKLLGQARDSVLMVDPYFGAIELFRFAAAVSRAGLKVRILTAEDFLRSPRPPRDASGASCGVCHRPLLTSTPTHTKGDLLAKQLANLLAQDSTLSIEVRGALGDPAPIHDRFLCIDSTVRALGSSLNEFGSRGTLMLKVPAPDEVRPHLETAWEAAEPLDEFIKRRAGK